MIGYTSILLLIVHDQQNIPKLLDLFQEIELTPEYIRSFGNLLITVDPKSFKLLSNQFLSTKLIYTDELTLLRLFYFVCEKKYKDFEVWYRQKNEGVLVSIENAFKSPFVDTFKQPMFLKIILSGVQVENPTNNHMLALLGVIRLLQDQKNSCVYVDVVLNLEKDFITQLQILPVNDLLPFLFGEVFAVSKIDLKQIDVKVIYI
jgi:hypothetical protein